MILLDKPYVSFFLEDTIIRNQYPVVDTAIAREFFTSKGGVKFISERKPQTMFAKIRKS